MNHAEGSSDGCFAVAVEDLVQQFECRGNESVLGGMYRLGRKGIPLGCRSGGCGVCKVEVLSGSYKKGPMSRSHVSEEDEAAHRVLACRIFPLADLELRVLGTMRKCVLGSPNPPTERS